MTKRSSKKSVSDSDQPVLDNEVLDNLFGETDEEGTQILRRVVASYCSGQLLEDARNGLSTGDWGGLERAAHNLKGLSYTIGTKAVAEVSAELEDAACREDSAACDRIIVGVASELERAYEALAGTQLYDAAMVAEMRNSRGAKGSDDT